MKFISSIVIAAALLPLSLQAKEISGVELNKTLTLNEQPLVLNGAGVRSKFFIDLYVGSLYVPTVLDNTAAVLAADNVAVRLNITSGMITADKMKEAINDGFDDATDGNTAGIQTQIAQFMQLFSTEIVDGDQFTLLASKTSGVTAFKNGEAQATITSEPFRQALLKIWLGDEPAQNSLKEAMLGQ
jgi:hypothetical protein